MKDPVSVVPEALHARGAAIVKETLKTTVATRRPAPRSSGRTDAQRVEVAR